MALTWPRFGSCIKIAKLGLCCGSLPCSLPSGPSFQLAISPLDGLLFLPRPHSPEHRACQHPALSSSMRPSASHAVRFPTGCGPEQASAPRCMRQEETSVPISLTSSPSRAASGARSQGQALPHWPHSITSASSKFPKGRSTPPPPPSFWCHLLSLAV